MQRPMAAGWEAGRHERVPPQVLLRVRIIEKVHVLLRSIRLASSSIEQR